MATPTMKAARFTEVSEPLELVEVPVPEPGPLEVVVKVAACGICLSDVHLIDGSIPAVVAPVVPGHESSGTVAAVGDLVSGWSPDERVLMMGGKNCGECARCASGAIDRCQSPQVMGFHYDGAWAEYVRVPFYGLTRVPEGIPMEEAAILADAVATPYAALKERGALKPGEAVGLWGIGGLGTHAVQLARLMGASMVIAFDPLSSARDRALKMGADLAFDPREDVRRSVFDATDGLGLDLALDLVGSGAVVKQAMSCLGREGRVVMVGLTLDELSLGPQIVMGLMSHSLMGHLGYSKTHLDELVRLLANRRLDLAASISDVIPLDRINEGVRRLAEKDGDPVRIIVRP